MEADAIAPLFTRADGTFLFARWGRPIAPVVFGLDDATLGVAKGAIEAVCTLAQHPVAQTDPDLGSNLMIFFLRDWDELARTPHLDRLIPDLATLLARLEAAEANQYRTFRFAPEAGIKAAFVFVRMDVGLAEVPAEALALAQVVQTMLVWSDTAFRDTPPLIATGGAAMLRPEIGALIRAAYDPVLPAMSQDPAIALRLSARMTAPQ